MEYAVLGRSGMRVSRLVLGTATFGVAPSRADAAKVVGAALDAGINAIDTANAYGNLPHFDREGLPGAAERESSEEIIGGVLGRRRAEVVLSTKASEPVGPGANDRGLSRRHLVQQLDQSLRRLRTDRVDLFYAHHPDPDTPLLETLMTLDDFVAQGKVMSYGLSTYPAWQTVEALWLSESHHLLPPCCLQVRYNLVARHVEAEIVPAALHWGLSLVAFSPLAGGLLASAAARQRPYAGETRWGGQAFTPSQLEAAHQLDWLASALGLPPHALALAWVLSRPGVAAAIIGAEDHNEVAACVQALAKARQLDVAQLSELDNVGSSGVIDPPGRKG